jgi:hypothetical protein
MPNSFPDIIESARLKIRSRLGLSALIGFHTIVCCVSLFAVAHYQSYMLFDVDRLGYAIVAVAAFSAVSFLFVLARFSFGYFLGFYFYTMVLGFIWLSCFTQYQYDQKLAVLSAAVSLLLFLLPALLINTPLKQQFALSSRNFERLLGLILVLSLATIVAASTYSFRFTSLDHIYDYRGELNFPAVIRYLIGIVSNALLPFAFACYVALNRRWWAGATLLLMLLFYPIALSKLAFFAPAWMVVLVILLKFFDTRTTTILSLLLPMLIGVILIPIFPMGPHTLTYFGTVNIRMLATPSSAMDIYNDFFANHPLTYFCQITLLKPLMSCPYQDQLSVLMEKTYGFGAINASLFATEGIASVGLVFAPLTALVCGLVMAVGNRLSAGLPPRFILISGALLPQVFLNVPFTTVLLTHGAGVLFLLWYVTPRAIFEQGSTAQTGVAG